MKFGGSSFPKKKLAHALGVAPVNRWKEVVAWRQIYNIDSRYLGFVKGRIEKWYKAYWQYLQADVLHAMAENDKKRSYFAVLEADESELLNYI